MLVRFLPCKSSRNEELCIKAESCAGIILLLLVYLALDFIQTSASNGKQDFDLSLIYNFKLNNSKIVYYI